MKARGQTTRALTEFVDIYPTLCDLTGLPLPGHLDGISFRPLMDNPELDWKSAAFSIWVHKKYRHDEEIQVIGYTMKTERYRYTEWRHTRSGEILSPATPRLPKNYSIKWLPDPVPPCQRA
jgi:arylsulfatase A-like enzyme